jgi:HEAT repeat protein
MRHLSLPFVAAAALGCAALAVNPPAADTAPLDDGRVNADVTPHLLRLLEQPEPRPDAKVFEETALRDIYTLITPDGYRLRFRLHPRDGFRVAQVQALALSRDPQLKGRLTEAARWTGRPRGRSEALIALSTFKDPNHFQVFREAFLDLSAGIRFAAIEAMQMAGDPQAIPLLLDAANNNPSPLMRVFAAQAALRMGDARGHSKLRFFLTDSNRLVRAMAARYLGDLGKPEDADILLARIGPEQENPFVLAEVCIAAIKLTGKRNAGSAQTPPSPPAATGSLPSPTRAVPPNPAILELEALVVTAPRLRAPRVDVRIDNSMVQLLQRLAEALPPDQQIAPVMEPFVDDLVTPAGFSIKIRYSDLSYLTVEGLAGAKDFSLVQRVEQIARDNARASVRSAALVSLGYNPERRDLFIFQDALRDSNVVIRFGAVEALALLKASAVTGALVDVAERDPSPALRVFASQALLRAGDLQGRERLLRYLNDPDWVIRAMAIHYLGDLGQAEDYYRIRSRLNVEDNNVVIAESCLAMLKLAAR